MRTTRFLPALMAASLLLGACAKQESDAAREAEINRRVQERLVAEHQAEEKQRLAQREAALIAREKALADRESSYGAMSATLAAAPPAAVESATETSDNGEAENDGVANPGVTGIDYPQQYGYPSYDEPDLLGDPYYYDSAYPSFTYFYTTPRVVFVNRRGFRGNWSGHQPASRMGGVRGVNMPPRMIARPPMPAVGHPAIAGGMNHSVLGMNHSGPRRTPTYTR